jgi:dTDP-4-amino-4,6-dideoxygalactose transaminase
LKNIPATKPTFSKDDISFITENFKEILSGKSFLSQYKFSSQFEREFASYTGTEFAVSCNSGTSALELIFRALDVKGREVILPSNTFIATANAIMNAGGIPVFADCDDGMCLDYKDTIEKITSRTIAICHVHIGGLVSDDALRLAQYCDDHGLFFVEDAAQAHGSINKGKKAGTLGIAAGFSFYSTKVMTTGEGGMVTTNDEELVSKMKSSREFGKEKKGIWTNYHTQIGYNWRMPEVAALLGIRQLQAIEEFIKKRTNIAGIYDVMLQGLNSVRIISPPEKSRFNYFKYMLVLEKFDREKIHNVFEKNGISPSGYVYELPLHKQPVFPEHNQIELPNTEFLCSNHFCLPIYPSMEIEDAEYIAETLFKVLDSD